MPNAGTSALPDLANLRHPVAIALIDACAGIAAPAAVSISIDPEHDTQPRIAEYAGRFGAGPQWQFYTGTAAASVAVQRAFGTYRGDKLNHEPVTFLRTAPGQAWDRIDGLATPEALIRQVQGTAMP
jgi:protein SCO1/2